MSDRELYEEGLLMDLEKAKARIEVLIAERDEAWNRAAHAEEMWGRVEVKLATCEKYRDAYAEFDRIGTQAVRDLDAKLAKANDRIEELEAKLTEVERDAKRADAIWSDNYEALKVKLAKAVEALETIVANGGAGSYHLARTTLAELTGGKDE